MTEYETKYERFRCVSGVVGEIPSGGAGRLERTQARYAGAATPRAMPKQQGDAANLLRPKAKLSPSSTSFFFLRVLLVTFFATLRIACN